MPSLFNLREWPLFRVARNVLGDVQSEAPPLREPPVQSLPIGSLSSQDWQAAALERELAVEEANNASLRQQEEDCLFVESCLEHEHQREEAQFADDIHHWNGT